VEQREEQKMEEIENFLIRLGISFLAAVLIGVVNWGLAARKGRDTIGWFLASFLPACLGILTFVEAFPESRAWWVSGILVTLLAPGILLALPGIETPGQTKRCTGCGKIIGWKAERCPWCGGPAVVPSGAGTRVGRPLRSCFLYLFLFVLLISIVFGLIGYFCVPNEPRGSRPRTDLRLP
jgi:uncharacterized membrane protein YhaH (DUF805 family)